MCGLHQVHASHNHIARLFDDLHLKTKAGISWSNKCCRCRMESRNGADYESMDDFLMGGESGCRSEIARWKA